MASGAAAPRFAFSNENAASGAVALGAANGGRGVSVRRDGLFFPVESGLLGGVDDVFA